MGTFGYHCILLRVYLRNSTYRSVKGHELLRKVKRNEIIEKKLFGLITYFTYPAIQPNYRNRSIWNLPRLILWLWILHFHAEGLNSLRNIFSPSRSKCIFIQTFQRAQKFVNIKQTKKRATGNQPTGKRKHVCPVLIGVSLDKILK